MLSNLIVDAWQGPRRNGWDPTHLEPVDVAPLLSSRGLDKTYKALEKTPYKFNFIVTDKVKCKFITPPEKMTLRERLKHSKYLSNVDTKDHITVILTHNVTSLRRYVPLTPWILVHRIGHAAGKMLGCGNNKFDSYEYAVRASIAKIQLLANKRIYKKSWKDIKDVNWEFPTDNRMSEYHAHDIATNLLTMHSARSNRLGSHFEWGPECLAQYVISGKVTFNRFEDWKIPPKGQELSTKEIKHLNRKIDIYEQVVNRACKSSLDFMVGKVLRF